MSKTEKYLHHLIGRLIVEKALIAKNDRILIGLSGGKDSWALCYFLSEFKKKAPVNFELLAVTLDIGFSKDDVFRMQARLREMNIEHRLESTAIQTIIKEKLNPGSSVCSLCARMRRAFLYKAARETGCNKVALGHHKDDYVETLLMNLFYHGSIKAMPPRLKAQNNVHELIRPLLMCDEKLIITFAQEKEFPIITCPCGQGKTLLDKDRLRMKKLIGELEIKHKGLKTTVQTSAKHVITDYLW